MMNFTRFSNSLYEAKNQNGFNQALYSYFGNTYSKKEIRNMVQNFPLSYPSSFIIIDQTFECSRIYVEILSCKLEVRN